MTKKVVIEKVLDKITYKEDQKFYKEVEKVVYICDRCRNEATYVRTCLDCGKNFCGSCADPYHNNKEMSHQQFQVGFWDIEDSEPTKDYKLANLNICKSCQEHPSGKLAFLMNKIKTLGRYQRYAYDIESSIIDEIEKLEKGLDL